MRKHNAAPQRGHGGTETRLKNRLRAFSMVLAMFALVLGVAVPAGPAEAANPSDGFQAGNIISDANFYDGNSMTVAEVQSFLNNQVPQCWLGRPGYEVGKPVQWGGPTKLASKCLKDFRITTKTEVANAYCAAMPGIANESAASVIVRVAKACGISAKVLLVMLDKEQSLVSDPWPNENQYFLAMGYACPDSGPGNSANCDPSRGGFAKQVYRAAWQYKVYRAFPESYRYKAFQNNYIQWHPNASCGGSTVRIENYATAALYIYTPYRPNQAALNAGWGTGDGCSSYGNRNFYNYYKAWFGAPTGDPIIDAKHKSVGGDQGPLGRAATGVDRYPNGGMGQRFEGGSIYYSPGTGARVVTDPVRSAYLSAGSWRGVLGFPAKDVESYPGGAFGQLFEGGSIYYSPGTGARVVTDPVRSAYLSAGSWRGVLGFPAKGVESYPGGAFGQLFEGGSIYYSPGTGARVVTDPVRSAYLSAGSWRGVLGFPAKDVELHPDGSVRQEFEHGWIDVADAEVTVSLKADMKYSEASRDEQEMDGSDFTEAN